MPEISRQACPRLIEVALPIREISAESVRDKSLRHGHISTLHLWWARRPLAASRAVVFASLVPDPDDPACPPEFRAAVVQLLQEQVPSLLKGYWRGRRYHQDPDPYRPYDDIPDTPRDRLLTFIAKWSPEWLAFEQGETDAQPKPGEMLDDRSLVKWETSDPQSEQGRAILDVARELVRVAYGDQTPVLLDPFAGGGAIPLEAGRLGCQAIANDYNPVAYLILRATCEFPQRYGKPGKRIVMRTEFGIPEFQEVEVPNVLAHDVEHWAGWILERARQQIGHLYPPGRDGRPVVGYLWARTAPCSNPACRAEIPLLRSLLVCNKAGKRVALTMTRQGKEIAFGIAKNHDIRETAGTMLDKGDCRCPICHQITPVRDLRRAGLEDKMGERMVAVITDTPQGKDYRPVEQTDLAAFEKAQQLAKGVERPGEYIVPEINAPNAPPDAGAHRSISVDVYGFKTFGALFNARQLVVMQATITCLQAAMAEFPKYEADAEYRDVVAAYLGLWISRNATFMTNLGIWKPSGEFTSTPFSMQAIPMVWDYSESNLLNEASGGALNQLDWINRVIVHESRQSDATTYPACVLLGDAAQLTLDESIYHAIITDPPYFDSIAYADLSDFFYVWLKRGLENSFPEAFATPQTPKSEEAVAHKHRHHGNREKGKRHFQGKLATSLTEARRVCKPDGVIAVMFAHQSTEAWTALISAILEAGLNVTATYPVDTERGVRMVALDVSALASSITVICRPRQTGTATHFATCAARLNKQWPTAYTVSGTMAFAART